MSKYVVTGKKGWYRRRGPKFERLSAHRSVVLLSLAGMFFLTGAVFGTWASRIPAIRDQLDLDATQLAIAFAVLNASAIVGLQLASIIVTRVGGRYSLQVSMPLFAATLAGLSFADSLVILCGIIAIFAVINSILDVAMNVQTVAVQQQFQRPMISRFHAMHSLGMIAGAGSGSLASAYGISPRSHFSLLGCVIAVVGLFLSLRVAADKEKSSAVPPAGSSKLAWRMWPRPVVVIGTLGFCATFAEGAGNDWTTVYLADTVGMSSSFAALGFASFAAALVVGRLVGDHLVAAIGAPNAFRVGTLTAGVGFGVSLPFSNPIIAILGIFALGLGVSYLFPIALTAAAALPDKLTAASAVAQISMLSYLGAFIGPLIIGPLANEFTLKFALGVPALIVSIACFGSRIFR